MPLLKNPASKWGMNNYTIQLFGSSIVEGRIGVERAGDRWYERMRRQLSELFPTTCFAIFNGAVGGQSMRQLMSHVGHDLAGHTPDLCIAMFGWNNCQSNRPDRHIDFVELRELMEKFLTKLPEATQVVGVVNQPVIDAWHFTAKDPAYDSIRAEYGGLNAYHHFERELARDFFRRHTIPYIDLELCMADNPEKYIVRDGIHLSPAGHELFADEAVRVIDPILRAAGLD